MSKPTNPALPKEDLPRPDPRHTESPFGAPTPCDSLSQKREARVSKHQSLKGLAERFRSDSHLGIKKNERPERGGGRSSQFLLDRLICGGV